ncbi:alpha/beta hydrolase family protein [Streptomyces sp. NBC_01268]|uniref:alpha/beta hydrolase family protein n=1 Tax=Streptomyces sp. NBC_01268 TaxID=2903806 RepID=UPI002E34F7A3|nr:prolyl oligopeptidase family serine peptidase [Streptomyces sp. NBC_01268]
MSTMQDYQAAEQLLRRPARPGELVVGDKVRPQWIDGGDRFWYAVGNGVGWRFVLVDPAAGTRGPAFGRARLAAALAAASGQQVDPEALPFPAIQPAGNVVEFGALGAYWRWVLVEWERADIGKLTATGWTPPERFRVKAADGVTDIYGVLYRPRGFDPTQRYAVVDNVYPGPQVNRVAPCFDPGGMGMDAEPLAVLGFVVVALDGRGTPGRSKAFHDASYGRPADAGCLADHVAALRQLAETRPWTDPDRIGVFGHSGGGFAAARAMLDFPEVFKAGVALSGSHDAPPIALGPELLAELFA